MHNSDQYEPVLRGDDTAAATAPRRRGVRHVASIAILALAAFGCSSAPDQPEQEVARKNQASRYTEFGNSYFNDADYEMALNFFELALQENIAVDNLPGIAKSYNSIGRVYAATENIAEARENYDMAMQFARLAEDDDQVVQTYINRGELYLREGDSAAALAAFEQARDAEADDAEINPILYHNLGTLYAREGDFDRAVEHLEIARAANEEAGMWAELASNYYMLSSVAARRESFEAAFDYATTALDYDKRAENSPGIAADLAALGRIRERTGEDEDAYQYYLRALRVYLSLNLATESLDLLGRLSDVADRLGKPDDAERFREERQRIDDLLAPASDAPNSSSEPSEGSDR